MVPEPSAAEGVRVGTLASRFLISALGNVRRSFRILTTIAAASSVGLTLMAPLASADDLNDQRIRVTQQLAQTSQDLGESNQQLTLAAIAVGEAQSRLANARAQLAQTRRELAAAKSRDAKMAAKLQQAKAALARAKAAVLAGEHNLAVEKALAGDMVRDQYQQQTNLLPIAILVQSNSMADLATRLQWSTTMFDTTQARIDRLRALQRQLAAERVRQTALEQEVAADRAVAAHNLMTKATLARRASVQTASVASLVRLRTAARAQAQRAVAADQARYAGLNKERASVEHRIAVRIAKAKAQAARKAAAARAAKIAAHRAAVAAKARQRAHARSAKASHRSSPKTAAHKSRTHKKSRRGSSSGGSSWVPITASSSPLSARSPLPTACGTTQSCITGNCTTAPTLGPPAGPLFMLPIPGGWRSGTTTGLTAIG